MNDRQQWLNWMSEICEPVLQAVSERRLKLTMPVEGKTDRTAVSHLEAVARTLAGIAPWLELDLPPGREREQQLRCAHMARRAIAAVTDPASPDYGRFAAHGQTLVEAAFLAHALLRAPRALWEALDDREQDNVLAALRATREIRPPYCNWLLFSAMIEAWLLSVGEAYDGMRIDYALRQHEEWYKGDGAYGDGPEFHWDYYNSFVIQPMLVDILSLTANLYDDGETWLARIVARAGRYAEIQERLIAPDGTFPAFGRSIAYRCGAFHLLAQLSLQRKLTDRLRPAQVRSALSAVMKRCLEAPGTFDANGWLQIGLCGHQPSLGEPYISTGSLYLCTAAFLPLGLPEADEFWSAADELWTSARLWSGIDMPADHAAEI